VTEDQAPAFDAWREEFFRCYYRRRPVNATFIGVHDHDDRLPDFSDRGMDEAAAEAASLHARLVSLPGEPLTEADALDRRLAEGALRIQAWEDRCPHFHRGNPCVYTGEAVFGVLALLLREFAPFAQRVEAAIARLWAVGALLRQGRANVRRAPTGWTERAIAECQGAHLLLGEGVDLLIRERLADDAAGAARLRLAGDAAVAAFAEFQHYLEVELRGRDTGAYGCGEEALALLLRDGHCLDWTAEEIAEAAGEEMATQEAALDAGASTFGAQRWQDALALLAERHPRAEAYYARYTEAWLAARAAAINHDLLTWPEFPIRYVPQPRWTRAAAPFLYFLAYRAPAPFDRAPVVDYLVPPVEPEMSADEQRRRLRATNDSVILLNHVIHHGGIGHHVQNWYAMRAASRIGQVAAVDCASRIAMFCGGTMAEGWACYATDLMDEIGFLAPGERYALHHARLRMAARALVDIRLHQGVFGLEDAVAVYRARVGMTPGAAYAEAVKNSMFPGTGLMYFVGTQLLHALRREEATRSPSFGLRVFHDRVLSYGSVPVSLIRAAIRRDSADGQHGRRP
jgi:uncharacterized protein (DUF885 family)